MQKSTSEIFKYFPLGEPSMSAGFIPRTDTITSTENRFVPEALYRKRGRLTNRKLPLERKACQDLKIDWETRSSTFWQKKEKQSRASLSHMQQDSSHYHFNRRPKSRLTTVRKPLTQGVLAVNRPDVLQPSLRVKKHIGGTYQGRKQSKFVKRGVNLYMNPIRPEKSTQSPACFTIRYRGAEQVSSTQIPWFHFMESTFEPWREGTAIRPRNISMHFSRVHRYGA